MKINNNNYTCSLFLGLLPIEIITEIFSRLPFDSVLQCKLVCKTWLDLANHHHNNKKSKTAVGFLLRPEPYDGEPAGGFYYGEYINDDNKVPCFNMTENTIFNHIYHPLFNLSTKENQYHPYESSRNWSIVGSCNGLICLSQKWRGHNEDMFVCNPYVGEYVKLPNLNYVPHVVNKAYGLGYLPITKEYKVIRICYDHGSSFKFGLRTKVHVQVYTLGSSTSSWRSKEKRYRSLGYGNESNSWGILLNGLMYWLTNTTDLIISFDLADEEFREIPTTLPEEFVRHPPGLLGVFNGCLCFSTDMVDNTHIWVMNNSDYTWIKKFTISEGRIVPYCLLAETGKILLICDFYYLITYDPETEHIVELKMMDSSLIIVPYTKSTVSLKALGEKAIQVTAV